MFKNIIFDMDGVLIDSQPLHYQIDIAVLRASGYPAELSDVIPFTGTSNPDRWPRYKAQYNLPQGVDELIALQVETQMSLFSREDLTAIDGIPELLRALRERGVKTAVASSSSHDLIDLVLRKTRLAGYFDALVSGEDVSAGKPAPDVFLRAAERLQAKPEDCAVIEDSPNGIRAAKNAGMFCVAYRNPTTYSQDYSLADYVTDNYRELPAFLLRENGAAGRPCSCGAGIVSADNWRDYELIDMGGGEKLERWGEIKVIRPDPQIIWPRSGDISLWKNAHMRYTRSRSGGGRWETLRPVPASWEISYKLNADSVEPDALKFHIRPTDFKHMGLFPEQAVNWEWAAGLIRNAGRPVRVLNLFGYTGGATVACLSAGAEVTHIDAAKGMNQWAKDNISLSNLSRVKHRVLADDAVKFIKREERRGSFYDAIIMDPPVYGRGPGGELWKLEDRLFELVCACAKILSKQPLFVLLNAYTAGFSPIVAANVLQKSLSGLSLPCRVSCGEIGLRASAGGLVLPCGMYGRCEF